MAKTNNPPDTGPDPLVTLTDEARKNIEELGVEIERERANLDRMEELGMDTSRLRAQIEWSDKARKFVLDMLK